MLESFLKKPIGSRSFKRASLPNEVGPLKDILVDFSKHFSKLWQDYDHLHQRVIQLEKDNAELKAETLTLKAEALVLKAKNLALEEEVALLKGKLYGKKSEKSGKKGLPGQSVASNKNRSGGRPGRKALPTHLSRSRVVHDVPSSQKVCSKCHGLLSLIGEEISEQLELVRAHLKVIEHARLKYACRCCKQTVVVAETPYKPVEKGLAGPHLIAYVVVSKFSDHLPLYRQEVIFKRYGVLINRSTLCGWVLAAAQSLKPLYERMKADLLMGTHIFVDDTHLRTLRVTSSKKDDLSSRAHKAYMWAYARDNGYGQKPIIVYHYTLGRGSDSLKEFLKGFTGYIQADAYGAYDFLFKVSQDRQKACIEVACWAHTRRKFVEAVLANPQSIASEVIELIGQLYKLERDFKAQCLSVKEVTKQRRLHSKPIVKAIHKWLKTDEKKVPPASTLGKGISYALNNWKALTVFLENGVLAIDNNFSERNIKSIVMGRKNYLFAGSEAGGDAAATLYSLIETCKQNGIDPEAYLADVLLKVQYHPNHRIDELLPYHWKPPGYAEEIDKKAA